MDTELTRKQLNRQDLVDNAIFQLLQELNPTETVIDWNIQWIGEIRDKIQEIVVEELNLCDEQTFYPFLEA
ncbi:MAG: hypothetical protein H7Y04_08865 [Verrucomicrobia bacterium]|nr:hypothetical protein [Cytophagales bacterium]